MKNAFLVFCVFVLILSSPINCFADATYKIEEYGFSVAIPPGLVVFTPGMSKTEPVWKEYGIDADQLIQLMKDNDMVLNAMEPNGSCEFIIYCRTNESSEGIYNLNSFADKEFLDAVSDVFDSEEAQALGVKVTKKEIYQNDTLKFFVLTGSQVTDEQNVRIKSYMTIVNGIFLQVTLRSYTGAISNKNEERLSSIIGSIQFSEIKSKPLSARVSPFFSNVLYKSLVAGGSALLISVPYLLIKSLGRKKDKGHERQEVVQKRYSTKSTADSYDEADVQIDNSTDLDDIRDVIAQEKIRRDEEDYQKILQAQKKRRVGKLMLSYGKHDREVIENAKKLNMSVDEFLALCKSWVTDYDELHREYNETHSNRVEYPSD